MKCWVKGKPLLQVQKFEVFLLSSNNNALGSMLCFSQQRYQMGKNVK